MTTTIYYPEGMEYAGVVDNSGGLITNNPNITITPDPDENKVVIDSKDLNINAPTVFSVKYKVPAGTPAGTYSTTKAPHAVITTYDDTVFEADALTSSAGNITTTAALDTCKVVDTAVNKLVLAARNHYINPLNETWAGSIQINNKQTAGMKKNQVYHIQFDPNWEAKIVNLPFDSTISGNTITNVQYKTNLHPEYQTYTGTVPTINSRMASLYANSAKLQEGEYFTEVQANVGNFSSGYQSASPSGPLEWGSTASYGIVKSGITSVQFKAEIWDANDETNTKSAGVSTYNVSNSITTAANGTANFYNKAGSAVKVASAGETITTKASLALYPYPYGNRTVLNDPTVYLRELNGTTINPSSIKLTDQDGKEVDFTIEQEAANNGEKVYVLKTTNTTIGAYIGYPAKLQYVNISYDTTFDLKLDKSINMDIQNVLAWGGQMSLQQLEVFAFLISV